MAKILQIERGGKTSIKLVLDGYTFGKKECNNEGIQTWRCDYYCQKPKGCTAKVYTDTKSQNQIVRTVPHSINHPAKVLDMESAGKLKSNKDAIIGQLKNELDTKEKALEAKDRALEAKDKELEAKDKELEAKDKELESLKKFLKDHNLTPPAPAALVSSNVGIDYLHQQGQFAPMPPTSSSVTDIFNESPSTPSMNVDIFEIEFHPDVQHFPSADFEQDEEIHQDNEEEPELDYCWNDIMAIIKRQDELA